MKSVANIKRKKICIKIPVPDWSLAKSWGDYHIAKALKKYFERQGYYVLIQISSEWDNGLDYNFDIILVLRGLGYYKPKPWHINLMWNISHPEIVSIEEYNEYDLIFVASEFYAKQIKEKIYKPVVPLLQCTDHELFFPKPDNKYHHELLFVGNSRKVMRKIIADLLPTEHDFDVYGDMWEGLIDKRYIKENYFPNEKLNILYSSCKILLNDHWDDMRRLGFISNRIFDALACGSFIISDNVAGLKDIFGDNVVTYIDRKNLKELIEYYLSHPEIREKIIQDSMKLVLKEHTFEHRIKIILDNVDILSKKDKA